MVGIGGIGEGSRKRASPVIAITYGPQGKHYSRPMYLKAFGLISGTANMTRREHQELQRKLARARRLALEPTDALTLERIAQAIEDLEYQIVAGRTAAQAVQAGY
jgi:hypothetical protein